MLRLWTRRLLRFGPDQDAQFHYVDEQVKKFLRGHRPVISVDTKKEEVVGDFLKGGKEYRKKGCPDKVRVHDLQDKVVGEAIPYDIASNAGWVNEGIDHDTAQFAAQSILGRWQEMGASGFPALPGF